MEVGVISQEKFDDDLIFGREVVVERRFANTCTSADFVHGYTLVSALLIETHRRLEQLFSSSLGLATVKFLSGFFQSRLTIAMTK